METKVTMDDKIKCPRCGNNILVGELIEIDKDGQKFPRADKQGAVWHTNHKYCWCNPKIPLVYDRGDGTQILVNGAQPVS